MDSDQPAIEGSKGKLMPKIDELNAGTVIIPVAQIITELGSATATYDAVKDAFVTEGSDGLDVWTGEIRETTTGPKKLYPIGNGAWIWDEA